VANDDWRVTITLHDQAQASGVRHALNEHEVEDEVRDRLGGRIVVGGGETDGVIFLYASSRDAAHEAERVVRQILQAHALEADFAVDRWHPLEERWEDEDVPLPTTDAARQLEHERLEGNEAAESEELEAALWEVRVELASHQDAVALAERLEAQSSDLVPGWTFSVRRRWKYLLIGADNEDQAKAIGEKVQAQLPPGATLHVEPSGALTWKAFGNNPFAILGGLGS
jgi:hypothetical protein